jgi:hypothetical protein
MRQAKPVGQVDGMVHRANRRKQDRKKTTKYLDVLSEFRAGQSALIAPAPELADQLAKHLPEQERRRTAGAQLIERQLSLGLLDRFISIDGVKEDIRVNGVHAVARGLDDLPSSQTLTFARGV